MSEDDPARRWWRPGAGSSSLILLGLVAAALIGGILLMWQAIAAERYARAQAVHTNAVLLALRDVSRTAVNAETGQRGYFITLDRRYLSPYLAAREQYRPNLARLRRLLGDEITPRQHRLLDDIDRLTRAKFTELEASVANIQSGELLSARRRILTDEGQETMERLRDAIGELEAIELVVFRQAREDAAQSEARIIPNLLVLLVFILAALVLGLWQIFRRADAEARAAHAQELAEARDRADLLARELNHRVKNLFAVVLAIVRMSGRDAPEAKPTVEKISDRIHALLTAHEVTQGRSAQRSARLAELVEITLKPHQSQQQRHVREGPDVDLPERSVVPLGLVLHELATNAVKYGAWSGEAGGVVTVRWNLEEDMLRIEWREDGGAPGKATDSGGKPGRGFGSSLIDGSARQLGGSIERDFLPEGLVVAIVFPLTAA